MNKGEYVVEGRVSMFATAVRVLLPVRPEAAIRVHVVEPNGEPAHGARLESAHMGGAPPRFVECPVGTEEPEPEIEPEPMPPVDADQCLTFAASSEPADADGWFRVRGVPHLQGEKIHLVVGVDDRSAHCEVVLNAANAPCFGYAQLPPRPNYESLCLVISGCIGCGGPRTPPTGSAGVAVEVRHTDGSPAGSVRVALCGGGVWRVRQTDTAGLVEFGLLPHGAYRVDVREPGFVHIRKEFTLDEGSSERIELVEPTGWTAQLQVLDADGWTVPFAELDVDTAAPVDYCQIDEGIQLLTVYTDERGQATLTRLPYGEVHVKATLGTRTGELTLYPEQPRATLRLPPAE